MRRKSVYTVKEATGIAFEKMDKKFHAIRLCQAVREITARPFLMDGTILRRLRELREREPEKYHYSVIDKDQGIYKKDQAEILQV
jgi:hypothetical protein